MSERTDTHDSQSQAGEAAPRVPLSSGVARPEPGRWLRRFMAVAAVANAACLALCFVVFAGPALPDRIWQVLVPVGSLGSVFTYLSLALLLTVNFALGGDPASLWVRIWMVAAGLIVFLILAFVIVG